MISPSKVPGSIQTMYKAKYLQRPDKNMDLAEQSFRATASATGTTFTSKL